MGLGHLPQTFALAVSTLQRGPGGASSHPVQDFKKQGGWVGGNLHPINRNIDPNGEGSSRASPAAGVAVPSTRASFV